MKMSFVITAAVAVVSFIAGKTYEAIREEKEELKHMETQSKNMHDIVDKLQKLNTVSERNHQNFNDLAQILDGYKKGYFEEVGFF